MKRYTDYLDNQVVDSEMHECLMRRLTRKPGASHRKYIHNAGLLAGAALLVCALILPELFRSEQLPGDPTVFDPTLTGLPVDNFSLADIQTQGGIAADRLGFIRLSDFFGYVDPELFAYVRVLDTNQWEEKEFMQSVGTLKQTATVSLLSAVWSRDEPVPQTFAITQSLYGGCVGDEQTNLLRKGGVYLLPLSYWNDSWSVIGDLDVLLEVDDQQRVWSHSQFHGFRQYDGQLADVLSDALTKMMADPNFSAATTPFGKIARHWGILAETTVQSINPASDQWGYPHYQYCLEDTLILTTAASWSWQPEDDLILAAAYSYIELDPGASYLMLLDPSGGGPYISQDRIAKINPDGTIIAITSDSVFTDFNGFTVDQMQEIAQQANTWHNTFAAE